MKETTGGLYGTKNKAMLESVFSAPFHTFYGEEFYPSVLSKITGLTYVLLTNHPFTDGNKRVGTFVMLIFLELSHIEAEFSDVDIIKIGLELASGITDDKKLFTIILERLR